MVNFPLIMANPNRLNAGIEHLQNAGKLAKEVALLAVSLPFLHLRYRYPGSSWVHYTWSKLDLPREAVDVSPIEEGKIVEESSAKMTRANNGDWFVSRHYDKSLGSLGGLPVTPYIIPDSAELTKEEAFNRAKELLGQE